MPAERTMGDCACGKRATRRGMCLNCYMRWYRALPAEQRQITHGTLTGYSAQRCRCEACRDAAREYERARRERRRGAS